MKTESKVTLDGVYYGQNCDSDNSVLNLDKIKAKKKLGLPLTAAEEQAFAAAQARAILCGKEE